MQKFLKIIHNNYLNAAIIFAVIAIIIASFTHKNFIYFSGNISETTTNIAYWQESSFAGCPQAGTSNFYTHSIFYDIGKCFSNLPFLVAFCLVFANLLSGYILLRSLKITHKTSCIGAIFWGSFSYFTTGLCYENYIHLVNIILICLSVCGCIRIFAKNYLSGAVILTLSLSLQTATLHYQAVYYTLLILLTFLIYRLITSIKCKTVKQFTFSTALTILIVVLSIFANSKNIFTQYDYAHQAITPSRNFSTSEINFDDKGELLSTIIPYLKGGCSASDLGANSEVYRLLEPFFGAKNAQTLVGKSPTYFGKQYFCNQLTYIGVIAIFFCIFGIIVCSNRLKWWLISLMLIASFLSLGNIEYFITEHLPLYNNYNNWLNIVVIIAIACTILFALSIDEIIAKSETERLGKKYKYAFYTSFIAIASTLAVFITFPNIAGNYNQDELNASEIAFAEHLTKYFPQSPEYSEAVADFKLNYISAIRNDRLTMIKHSSAIAMVFCTLAATVLLLFLQKRLSIKLFLILLSVAIFADNFIVVFDYFHKEENEISSYAHENLLLEEKTHFRVIDIMQNGIFDNTEISKKINSLSGDGYCLQRYKTLCDTLLSKEVQLARYNILSWLQRDGLEVGEIQELFSQRYKSPFLDLLNVKYLLLGDNYLPIENTHVLGNSWFVDSIRWADTEQSELQMMKNIDFSTTAVISKKYELEFSGKTFGIDSSDNIEVVDYRNDYIKYRYNCKNIRLAIFSEIYAKGWQAEIDKQSARLFRGNYTFRAMILPSGHHEIELYYQPKSIIYGRRISGISILMIVGVITSLLVFYIIEKRRNRIYGDRI